MLLAPVWTLFEETIFSMPSPERQFNPYRDRDDAFDLPDAPALRRANLRSCLESYAERPPLFLLAEAPGPWGCRFSGVPLVSEAQLVDESFPIRGRRSSTRDEPHTEYSAGIYWRALRDFFPHFFTWNSVPFHPHAAAKPLSIRTPTRREVAAYEGLLTDLLGLLQPRRVVAVGRKAERALESVGVERTYVRHPSQGGAKKFARGVQAVVQELREAA